MRRLARARATLRSAPFARAATHATTTFDGVAPGATVAFDSERARVDVVVAPHASATERIEIEIADDAHDAEFEITRARGDGGRGEVVLVRDARTGARDGTRAAVRARIPPRFCGVDARLRGENSTISVESVVEAGVKVRTNGGDVELGTIKGSTMDLDTSGGAVRARGSVSADSRVRTAGGDVTMRGKFVGSVVYVDTEPEGKFHAEAVFGDKVNVNTGGGDATAKSLRVGEFGLVRTSGGAVSIGSLEGAGEEMIGIDSGGGDVSVKFAERVHIAHVNSRGGGIDASFPSGFSPQPHVIGVYRDAIVDDIVQIPSADGVEGVKSAPPTARARLVHGSADEVARKVAAAAEGSFVTLDASNVADAGIVRIDTHSWFTSALAAARASSSR